MITVVRMLQFSSLCWWIVYCVTSSSELAVGLVMSIKYCLTMSSKYSLQTAYNLFIKITLEVKKMKFIFLLVHVYKIICFS